MRQRHAAAPQRRVQGRSGARGGAATGTGRWPDRAGARPARSACTPSADGQRLAALEIAIDDEHSERWPSTRCCRGWDSARLGPIADWGLAMERKLLMVDPATLATSLARYPCGGRHRPLSRQAQAAAVRLPRGDPGGLRDCAPGCAPSSASCCSTPAAARACTSCSAWRGNGTGPDRILSVPAFAGPSWGVLACDSTGRRLRKSL